MEKSALQLALAAYQPKEADQLFQVTEKVFKVTRATVYRWVRSAESESSINSQIDCETIMESGNRHGCITIAGVAKK